MIWNSHIWKNELIIEQRKFNKYLRDIRSDKYDTEHFVLGFEKFYFVTAFILRKLVENHKVSDELLSENYKAYKYKRNNVDKRLDIFNLVEYWDFYDMNTSEHTSISIKQICNLFIHSFILAPIFNEELDMEYSGVFVNTDNTKDSFLYLIDYEMYLKIIDDVIKDDINQITYESSSGVVKRTRKLVESYINEEKYGV